MEKALEYLSCLPGILELSKRLEQLMIELPNKLKTGVHINHEQAPSEPPSSQTVDWRFLAKQNEAARRSPDFESLADETRRMFGMQDWPQMVPSTEECVRLALEEQKLASESADRDLTIPNWVDVPCPQCGVCLTPVNANTVEEIKWPLWEHECGYSGPVEWINPDPPSAVWERRRIRETQLEDFGTSD